MTTNDTVENIETAKPGKLLRWIILIFISLAMFGNYFIYDVLSPAAKLLSDQLNFSDLQIGNLQSIYSLVNIPMLLLSALIVDRLGTKKSVFIFSLLCMVGAVISILDTNYWVIWFGRLIFGLGTETMLVGINMALAKWFKGKELSLAFGINLSIARLGSIAAMNSALWAKPMFESWRGPLLLGAIFGIVSVVSAIVYWIIEARSDKKYKVAGVSEESEKIEFKGIFKFSASFWFVVALCTTFYSGVFPFQTFAIKLFQEARGMSAETAGFLNSALPIFAIVFTPLFGYITDRIGKRSFFMFMGSLLMIPVYLMVAYSDFSLFIPMAMMGIAFSVIPAVMWPSVAYIVEEKKIGTAYALMALIQNIGMAAFNIVIGWANDISNASADNPAGYNLGMWIFSILGFVGLLFSFLLWKQEKGPNGHGLETITTKNWKDKVAAE